MHSLKKPEYVFKDVFDICVNSMQSQSQSQIKEKLQTNKDSINNAVKNYDYKMGSLAGNDIKTVIDKTNHPSLHGELKKLYSDQMVGKNKPASKIYDEMLGEAQEETCCFCSYRDSEQLDHFLPKSKFSEFSVAPINLVPVCSLCNQKKAAYSPTSITNSFIHPYYETCTEDILWLGASVDFIANGPVVKYFILDDVNQPLKDRLKFQLNFFGLNERYSLQSAREFSDRKYRWANYDIEAVKKDLKDEGDSAGYNNKNSWKSALYKCLLQSDEFCEMKWRL